MSKDALPESLLNLSDDAVEEWINQHRGQFDLEMISALRAEAEEIGYGGDLDSALRILDRAEQVTRVHPAPLAMGIVWRGRASVLQRHDRFEESLEASAEAVALYEQHGTPFDVAVARTVEVYTLGALGRFDEAIEVAHWIRPHFVREGFALGEAYVAGNLAQVYTWTQRHEEAFREYWRARRLFLQLDRPAQVATVLHDMGVAAEQMDRLSLARRCYTHAYPALVASGNVFCSIKTQYNLALLCLRQGQYEDALEHLSQARADLAFLPDSPDTAYVDLFEARVRRALGQSTQAEGLLKQALATFQDARHHIESAETLVEIGFLLMQDPTAERLAEGLTCLKRAKAFLQNLNVPLLVAWAQLAQGECLLRLQRVTEAIQHAEEAHSVFSAAGLDLRRAQAEALLGDCCWRLQPDHAQQWYQSALETVGENVPLLAARCWQGIGQLAAAAGDVDAAEQHYRRAVTFLDDVRRSLRGHSHQAGFLEDRQELTDDLLAVLHERPSGEQRVLAWVEQLKASALADLLARHPPDSGTDTELACLLMERERLRDKFDWQMPSLLVEIDVPASQRGPTLAACDARRAKSLSVIRLQLQQLEEQILRQWDGACEWREGTVIDPTRVHQLLDEQTTLISYYSAKGQLFALTATRTEGDLQIHPLRISLAEVERQWWQARRLVTRRTSQTADVQSRMAYFWETLIAPLEQRLCNRARLLILPHRGLFHIPYAGLYDAERGQYLIERWAVQLAPSATILDRCRRRTPGTQKPLLVGFPGHRGQADYLPGVEKEVRTLSSLVSASDVLVGEHATAHNVMTAASGRSLVHLAGHAFYNNVNPLESGMPLAGGRWLRAADLYLQHGHLAGSTVVLSGCSTGRGRPTGGDVLGLTSAFLYAGAVAIIASLWRVDDAATVELMTTFYRALKEGAETADALREAQVELLQSKRHAPPYFWAPFGLSGDSQVTKFSEVSWPNNTSVL